MKHLVFVDGNGQIFNAIKAALECGHTVSFIQSGEFQYYQQNAETEALTAHLHARIVLPRTTDTALVLDALRRLDRQVPVDAVFSLLDLPIVAVADACKELGLRFPDRDALVRTRDKGLMRETLHAQGIPSAKSAKVRTLSVALDAAADIGYPVILKPVSGLASIAATCVHDEDAMRSAWQDAQNRIRAFPEEIQRSMGDGLLVEERLAGDMFSVEIAVRDGTHHVFMLSGRDRNAFDETDVLGITMPACLSAQQWDAAVDYAKQVLNALGFDFGFFHVEMMWTDDGPRLIEVNPRPMGGSMPMLYRQLTGHDIFKSLFALHLDEPLAFAWSPAQGYIASWRIRLAKPGVLSAGMSWQQFGEADPDLVNMTIDVAGDDSRLLPEFSLLGRFQIRRASALAAADAARALLNAVERASGLQLVYPSNVFTPSDASRAAGFA